MPIRPTKHRPPRTFAPSELPPGVPVLFTELEAAGILRVSVNTLRFFRTSGRIAFRKIGKLPAYTPEDLADFVACCAVRKETRDAAADQ